MATHNPNLNSNMLQARTSLLSNVLNRQWLVTLPDLARSRLRSVPPSVPDRASPNTEQLNKFWLLQDDLLHPFLGGNKLRKLDAVIPALTAHGTTHVVTCGGLQSAHTVAVAASCAEHGMETHLLLRGEPQKVPTGYALLAGMFGHVSFVPRSEYADRTAMLERRARIIGGPNAHVVSLSHLPSQRLLSQHSPTGARIVIIPEGGSDVLALYGLIRLVSQLAGSDELADVKECTLVVDSGTGTTAVGLALGIHLMGLAWNVTSVMLAGSEEYYRLQQERLVNEFCAVHNCDNVLNARQLSLSWIPRIRPRKFGNILDGEVDMCRRIARETGVLLDPIYTLSAWEAACQLSSHDASTVVMVHTGGTFGLFGLAQRYPSCF